MSSTPQSVAIDLPQLLEGSFDKTHFQLLNKTITDWFNSRGFYQPSLTDAQVSALMALPITPPLGAHWLNTTQNKMQFIDGTNTVQTITST